MPRMPSNRNTERRDQTTDPVILPDLQVHMRRRQECLRDSRCR